MSPMAAEKPASSRRSPSSRISFRRSSSFAAFGAFPFRIEKPIAFAYLQREEREVSYGAVCV